MDKERKRKLPRHDVGSVRTQPAKKQRPLSGRIPKCAGTVRTSGKITVLPRGTITAKLPFEKKATQVNLTWAHPQHGKTTLEVQNLQMVMDFTKKTLDIHNQGTGERLAGVTLEDTETCELHLLIDQEVIEFFTNRGTSYGAVETEENVLGGNLLVKSEIPVDEITYHRFEV